MGEGVRGMLLSGCLWRLAKRSDVFVRVTDPSCRVGCAARKQAVWWQRRGAEADVGGRGCAAQRPRVRTEIKCTIGSGCKATAPRGICMKPQG